MLKKKIDGRTIARKEIIVLEYVMEAPGGGTWVIFFWVCAAGLSEPLPYFSLFRGQLKTPSLSAFGQDRNGMTTVY